MTYELMGRMCNGPYFEYALGIGSCRECYYVGEMEEHDPDGTRTIEVDDDTIDHTIRSLVQFLEEDADE